MSVAKIKRAVRERDDNRCTECGMTNQQHKRTFGKSLEVHRVVPGSEYTVDACTALCMVCHARKPKSPRGSRLGSVNISPAIHRLVRRAANLRDTPFTKYLNELLQAAVEADYRKLVANEARDLDILPSPAKKRKGNE